MLKLAVLLYHKQDGLRLLGMKNGCFRSVQKYVLYMKQNPKILAQKEEATTQPFNILE